VVCMLLVIWLWFSTRNAALREKNQRTVLITMISIGMASAVMAIINAHYFRVRPFNALPPDAVNVIFYRPTDSSFPSNFAAVIFAFALPVCIRKIKYGAWMLALAVLGSFGRVYMGVHYPLDVMAGAGVGLVGCGLAFGIAWVLRPLMTLILKILRFFFIA
jgi:undecaprenyl-diphosphatase